MKPSEIIEPTRPVVPLQQRWSGVWEGRNVGSFLDDCVVSTPNSVAIHEGAASLTYEELDGLVASTASWLSAAGVGPGQSVLVQLPNWWEAIVVFHAIIRLGAVVNPVVPIYRASELAFIIRQSRPAAVIVPQWFRGFDHCSMIDDYLVSVPVSDRPALVVVRPAAGVGIGWARFDEVVGTPVGRVLAPPASTDIALLLYTSGTTAAPKGVLHCHETLVYETRSIIDWFQLGDSDRVFMGSPVTHITGFLYGVILPTITATCCVLLDIWDPGVAADLIERWDCSFTVGATPFLQGLTDEYGVRGQPSALKYFACGGADVPPALVRDASTVLDATVCRVYGSSEFPTVSCGVPSASVEELAATDGLPIGDVVVRLDNAVDGVGELIANGPELFLGYLDPQLNEECFTADGFFRTGDLASIGPDGAITIRGRVKDIIIRNGENVSAREIEDILFTHPSISDVAVVAVPDPRTGERACAVVVPAPDSVVTLENVTAFLREFGLAKPKWPEELVLRRELPRTPSGKVQKFVLRRSLLNENLAAEAGRE